jgi:phosphoribosylanthranilate isomerase
MPRTRIKICGITNRDTMLAAADAGADAVGLVFIPTSPRWITPEAAWQLAGAAPPMLTTVGLTKDLSLDDFADIESVCPTAMSQLHGSEADDVVRELGPDVIKAVRFDPATIRGRLEHYASFDEIAAVLVDGSAGGMGETFDWAVLAEAKRGIDKPIIIAGGLTAQNVGVAIRTVRPFAVDVSSGVERERGVKDTGLIHAFCDAVRAADRE